MKNLLKAVSTVRFVQKKRTSNTKIKQKIKCGFLLPNKIHTQLILKYGYIYGCNVAAYRIKPAKVVVTTVLASNRFL